MNIVPEVRDILTYLITLGVEAGVGWLGKEPGVEFPRRGIRTEDRR